MREKLRASVRGLAAMGAAVTALSNGTASAQGVPIFDAAQAIEQARQMAEQTQDRVLQIGKGDQRARLDEIKRAQLEVLDSIIESSTINPADVTATIQSLEAGQGAETAATTVYPAQETNLPATQLFGDARQNIEEMIIEGARETHNHPGVAKAGLSLVQWRALLQALIWQESRFNPAAESHVGAYGLTQIMPDTARDLGIYPAYRTDPLMQVRGGAHYLASRLDHLGGNITHALAAYNAGLGRVQQYGGVPPFAETQNYVVVIPRKYNEYLARLGGIDALGTIEPTYLANGELALQGLAAIGYAELAYSTIQAAAQRLAHLVEQVGQSRDWAAAQALNTYARTEIARLLVLSMRLQAVRAKPLSAAQLAVMAQMADEKGFSDMTLQEF
ncbi:lytic transglycosylase domain-containing protein [Roseinatronobacter alkalisoli]|uniref:Lytic transglycosylase domain-containing protein n=1 Tax=Roseinatronobacter alkalisoli TaxID=3028235 RepID=A0ABT5TAN5_9RHOB|nr:lytic transglycosylase domain-containing protein [Roseinatronobacter sp. HJB301]MDD7972004.1 lytic transglycosylase domain-containing protein [Roseinatronobacter sp. HJB301]